MSIPGHLLRAAVAVGAAAAVGGLLEARAFQLVHHAVTLPGAAKCRILHISDTHYLRGQRAKAEFLASLAHTQPDLVVFTGDMVGEDEAVDEFLDALSGLLALPGVFVRGSNDYFGPQWTNPLSYLGSGPDRTRPVRQKLEWHLLCDALADAGWNDIDNAAARLEVNGAIIEFRGTDDAHMDQDNYKKAAKRAKKLGKDAPDLIVGVTHSPYRRVLAEMAEDGVDLVLAGHTHGGQICLPLIGALVSNCDLPPALAKGLFQWPEDSFTVEKFSVFGRYSPKNQEFLDSERGGGDQAAAADPETAGADTPSVAVHITAGVGASPNFPLRLFCRPEACLLEIEPN